jgi:hypothetical protein
MMTGRRARLRRLTRPSLWLATSLIVVTVSACVSGTIPASSNPSDAITVLQCQDLVGSEAEPPSGYGIVLDRVALPTGRALQADRSGQSDPAARLFAKDALRIRRGVSVDLVVPNDWRGRLSVHWGFSSATAKRIRHLRIPGCRPTKTINPIREQDEWLVYAGGYWVSEPACVALLVRAGQTEQTIHVGVGLTCPGQAPPA